MSASLAGKLPSGSANGLDAITADMLADPSRVHVAVVLVDCSKITRKTDEGDTVPTVRVRRIEALTDDGDMRVARRLLEREWERRTGGGTLPFELEQDVAAAFDAAPERNRDGG